MTEKQVLDIIESKDAILDGHFNLSSGLHSPQYLQCARVLMHPRAAEKLGKELAKRFADTEIDTVIAPALGGILVSHEVAKELNVKSFFTERVEGKMTLRRGFHLDPGEKVLVVEDVITTGLSTREVIKTVEAAGAEVIGVGCLIDRSKGSASFDAQFESLASIDIPTYKPETCPLCAKKIPLTKPGSRK